MTGLVLHLRIAGVTLIGLALLHIPIARRFQWQEEAARLSPFNGQVLLVHAGFIGLTVGLMGALSLFCAEELASPGRLGTYVAAGLALFWCVRLFVQLFVYDSALWRGKSFETAMHVFFTCYWGYLTLVFGWRGFVGPS